MRTAVYEMKELERLTFRKGDGVVIGAVILAAVGLLLFFLVSAGGGEAKTVRIYRNGEMIREIPLAEDAEYFVTGTYENRVTVRDGRAAVTESSCPGADCVHSGWISQAGRSIVCLPNRVEVRIEGSAADDDVDAVIR